MIIQNGIKRLVWERARIRLKALRQNNQLLAAQCEANNFLPKFDYFVLKQKDF